MASRRQEPGSLAGLATVARTLSYLRRFRASTPVASDKSFEEIYEDPIRFRRLVHNHMVKLFALQPSEMTFGMMTEIQFTPAHLVRAKEQLSTVDVVGLQEQFPDFCAELEQRFGWKFGDAFYANRTKPVSVSAELRARIAIDNALDVELYEYAKDLVANRRGKRANGITMVQRRRHGPRSCADNGSPKR